MRLRHLSFFLTVLIAPALTSKTDKFVEELLIKPLYSEQLYAHFQFATTWDTDAESETFRHTHIFPRALGEIIHRHSVHELHVSLTGGLWRYEQWGYPVVDAAPGAEAWAWFRPGADADREWRALAGALSGLLCASLNFVEAANTVRPAFALRPRGARAHANASSVRYASLPREVVCTENLTPWKKLLPCEAKAGLASLLNSGYIHNTRYHSIALHVRPVCRTAACDAVAWQLEQSVSLVYDYAILGTKNWSLRKLFGQGIMSTCPLAASSTIYIDTTGNSSVPFLLTPPPPRRLTSTRGGHQSTFAVYPVHPHAMTINAAFVGAAGVLAPAPPALHANQYITGYGHERGGIVTKVYNNHWAPIDVVVLQNIPWYVPIYLHTLTVRVDGVRRAPAALHYVPGRQRERPYHLEVLLRLPARSAAALSVDFDYVFLKWQEYPPDANHGFYVGSAVVSAYLPLAGNFTGLPQDGASLADAFNASRSGYLVQVRTENLVVTLPTPDFSMPYNVICLACTVVALAFGPLHNITTKRLVLTAKDKEAFVGRVRRVVVGWWRGGEGEAEEMAGGSD